jgi:NAD(P)-dependent dehydrogenase (short-subunit alcohol dehydrogenase family)
MRVCVQFPRIVNMSSNLGSIAKSRGGCVSYRCSKSALNQLTRCLQQELHSACVISIHPCAASRPLPRALRRAR